MSVYLRAKRISNKKDLVSGCVGQGHIGQGEKTKFLQQGHKGRQDPSQKSLFVALRLSSGRSLCDLAVKIHSLMP
jgi:hypothetical protein